MLPILALIIGLGSLACWIYVEVKIFQSGNIMMGVLGLCPLVAFIYGWIKNDELEIRNVMLIWSVLFVANIFLNIALRSSQAGAGGAGGGF